MGRQRLPGLLYRGGACAAWCGVAAALAGGCKTSKSGETQPTASSSASVGDSKEVTPVPGTLADVLAYEDTDDDRRITVRDEGARSFELRLVGGGSRPVKGTYHLANLVQELVLSHRDGKPGISLARVEEPPAARLTRLIRERYWENLTRRIDEASLERVLTDSKMDGRRGDPSEETDWPEACTKPRRGHVPRFLYVPHGDEAAYRYYAAMTVRFPWLVVCRLPERVTPEWVQGLSRNANHGSRHGLLSLALERSGTKLRPRPYVVPGGRFNEMYGWDSYFILLGLLQDGNDDLALATVDNHLYEVRHYGQVLNANRTYYLTRTQPPFLSSSVRAVWEHTGARPSREWLSKALNTVVDEYDSVWASGPRRTDLCEGEVCLARYHGAGIGQPPEVEAGHFAWLYRDRARRRNVDPQKYERQYRERRLPAPELAKLDEFFTHDRSMRESGHDTTYRWYSSKQGVDRCADFATIDLNALLFKYELDIAHLTKELGGKDWQPWCERARARQQLVQQHLWDDDQGLFVDYDVERDERSRYVSATTLFPLWASTESPCDLELLANDEQAKRLVASALDQLEAPGGLASTSRASLATVEQTTQRQWDYPNGWAPHQMLAWEGLRRHGFAKESNRLTYRWLYTILRNAHDFHGTVPEKFDVVKRSHLVFAEYGNVGTDFSYITEEGFGWMNASFQVGRATLSPALIAKLQKLDPPESVPELQTPR